MFFILLTIILLFDDSRSSDLVAVNIDQVIHAFQDAAPQFVVNHKEMTKGLQTLTHTKSIDKFMKILSKTVNEIGTGYIDNSHLFQRLSRNVSVISASDYGNIKVPAAIVHKISHALNKTAIDWNSAYLLNIKFANFIQENENLLMNPLNRLPASIVKAIISSQMSMMSIFENMAFNSQLAGNSFSQLTSHISGLYDGQIDRIALFFYNNITPFQTAKHVLYTLRENLLKLKSPTVTDLMAAFHKELFDIIGPYYQLLASADRLERFFSMAMSSSLFY